MKASELQPGTKLEIEIIDNLKTEGSSSLYISEFEWAEGDKTIYVAAPIYEGKYVTAYIGMKISLYICKKNEFYKIKAIMSERLVKEGLPLYKLNIEPEIERIQRRQFFRFDCVLDVRCREVELENNKVIPKGRFSTGLTRDISGGGTCLVLMEGLEKGKMIECELRLSEQQVVKFLGTIVRSHLHAQTKDRFEAGVEFFNIDNKTRESIISFIFQEQRKLRQKGLI
ncbi:MAG: PilZ domain-containing protein [Bacillota bacterium]|nr:PilZ domain-containing protein [Bacillota bacterium]